MMMPLSPRPRAPPSGRTPYVRMFFLASLMAIFMWARTTTRYANLYNAVREKQVNGIVSKKTFNVDQMELNSAFPVRDDVPREHDETDAGPSFPAPKMPDTIIKHKGKDSPEEDNESENKGSNAKLYQKEDALRGKSSRLNSSGDANKSKSKTKTTVEMEKAKKEAINGTAVIAKSPTDAMENVKRGEASKLKYISEKSEKHRKSPSKPYKSNVKTSKDSTTTKKVPEVIWLMSFPNSGTTYTNKMVQGISQTTTATNYGQEQSSSRASVPMSPDLSDGPYLRYPEMNHSNYVLTKTHCGGYCSRCTPPRYVLTAKQFESDCRSGNKVDSKGKSSSTKPAYPADLPKKAVHILRNPLDNIVARLHMERKNWANHGNHEDFLKLFTSDMDGFRKYCKFLYTLTYNATFESDLLDHTTKSLYRVVPCASEFYRYVQWHNLVIEVTDNWLHLPTHTMFYEDYSHKFNETVGQLMNFLELEAVSTPPAFIKGKEYQEYFTKEQLKHAGQLVKHLATNKTWALLKHYFEGIISEEEE